MNVAKTVKPKVKMPEIDFYGAKFEPEKGPMGMLGEVLKLANNDQLKKDIDTIGKIANELKDIDFKRLAQNWAAGHLKNAPRSDPNPFNVFYQR